MKLLACWSGGNEEEEELVVIGCDSGFIGLAVESNDCGGVGRGDLEETLEGVEVEPSSLFLLAGRACGAG